MTIEELRKQRIDLGITQAFVAEQLDVAKSWISVVESGKRNAPKILLIAYKVLLDECKNADEPNWTPRKRPADFVFVKDGIEYTAKELSDKLGKSLAYPYLFYEKLGFQKKNVKNAKKLKKVLTRYFFIL